MISGDKNKCAFCKHVLDDVFVDLGLSPLANSYVDEKYINKGEMFFPLKIYVCKNCFLVQSPQMELPENIFSEYHYFSSFSRDWLEHAKSYAGMIAKELELNEKSTVVEVASNDGYLLQYFKEKNINVLGVEPAKNIAEVANNKGISTICDFFCEDFAVKLGKKADLVVANNVLAHVPDINSFVKGLKIVLKEHGTITVEFPSLMNLIRHNQFDTIYHEHFSYLSLTVVKKIFETHGLKIYNVENLPTHGGSLRVYACHDGHSADISESVGKLLCEEESFGIKDINMYARFNDSVIMAKRDILKELINLKEQGKQIAGYGAAAKGNTLLNYCGIGTDFIDYVVDANPHKQGKFLPGSRIPIYEPKKIDETEPDYVIILPWNLKNEISEQLSYIRQWGGKFITLIPGICEF